MPLAPDRNKHIVSAAKLLNGALQVDVATTSIRFDINSEWHLLF
ncbi:hypothetical protein JCM19238_90 [Vibrio ponticus]|nr:hypothetical protein JCM19238_90 [Vibrio ponticus]